MTSSNHGLSKLVIVLSAGAGLLVAGGVVKTSEALAAETTLYTFVETPSAGPNGCNPAGPLFRDSAGALYGTTRFCGAFGAGNVFSLKPLDSAQTKWGLSVLYNFQGGADGNSPQGGVIMDAHGVLYGTTVNSGVMNGQNGVVFKLTPQSGSSGWKEDVIHPFGYSPPNNNDGASPVAGLVMDGVGALYGTTQGGGVVNGFGTVFRLSPPGWAEQVLYRFSGGTNGQAPRSSVTLDNQGVVYGTTLFGGRGSCLGDSFLDVEQCGTVFRLTPKASGWVKDTLYSFSGGKSDGGMPWGQLWRDASGALFGTTYRGGNGPCAYGVPFRTVGCGTVFKLIPSASGQPPWRLKVLHHFQGPDGFNPQSGITADNAGRLYGTASNGGTNNDGVVFRLSPAAQGAYNYDVLHHFSIVTSGSDPDAGVVPDPQGRIYTATEQGGSGQGGTIVRITP